MKEDIQPKKKPEKTTISISGETSERLELYCKANGILRKDFVSLALEYFERTGFDLQSNALDYSPLEKIIGELKEVKTTMQTSNEGTEAVRQLLQAVREQTAIQKQLPAPDILQKATDRVAELEHLIGKYQEKLDSLSEDRTRLIKERGEWEQKFYNRDKQNFILSEKLQTQSELLKAQSELLEKAKTELRHCKGFFTSANNAVLKELGI